MPEVGEHVLQDTIGDRAQALDAIARDGQGNLEGEALRATRAFVLVDNDDVGATRAVGLPRVWIRRAPCRVGEGAQSAASKMSPQ